MAILCHECFGVIFGNVPETATGTEVALADPDETQMCNSGQLEGENIIHDQKIGRRVESKIAASRN